MNTHSQPLDDAEKLQEMPITKHLIVLRRHLFKIVGLLLVLFFLLIALCQ